MVDDPSPANHFRLVSALIYKYSEDHCCSCGERDETKCRMDCRNRVGAAVKVINDSHATHIKISAAKASSNSLGGEVAIWKGMLHGRQQRFVICQSGETGSFTEVFNAEPREFSLHDMI